MPPRSRKASSAKNAAQPAIDPITQGAAAEAPVPKTSVNAYVSPAEFSRVTALVRQAQTDPTMEVESAVTYRATPTEFSSAIAAVMGLPGASKPDITLQLDCSGGSKRWEFIGEDRVRAFLRRGDSIGPQADRVLEKRRAAEPVDLEEWPIRVNLKTEKVVTDSSRVVPQAAQVQMRLKRRVSVAFQEAGVRVDMTIVMESGNDKKQEQSIRPQHERLQGRRHHEIEVEALPGAAGDPDKIAAALLAYVHCAYCAAKGTSEPLPRSREAKVLEAYAELTGTPASKLKFKFVGPSPVTLNRENIVPPGSGVISILENYTVTDKADGERRLLVIVHGNAYLMDNRANMSLAFKDTPPELNGTILDGELITRARLTGSAMRMFAAFDAYWQGSNNVAALPLLTNNPAEPQRVQICKTVTNALHTKAKPVDGLHAVTKTFVAVGGPEWGKAVKTVYDSCTKNAPYEVDGLIFTPADVAVGASRAKEPAEMGSGRWALQMKWKPPSHNSVDFLARFKRDRKSGVEIVKAAGDARKKTCVLYAGYTPSKYEPIDPLDYLTRGAQALPRRIYIAKVFQPPGADEIASEIDLAMLEDGRVLCEDGDTIEDNTIVEFRWTPRGWVPMRVRHDKTEKMAKTGLGGTLNEWATAMGVWNSIQNPVTLKMVTNEEPVPPSLTADADVYYDRGDIKRDKTGLKSMADFHNIVVKAGLYNEFGVRGGSLLELACGMGGDIPRWLGAGVTTMVGVDVANDNIVNPAKGVYARWETAIAPLPKEKRPHGIFITLDASIRMFPPLDNMREASAKVGQAALTNVMFGLEPSVPKVLEPFNGVMTKGFDLVSCQFAVHYMFKDDATLDSFIANVARMTRVGGHFIGTTFDGDAVASALVKGQATGRVGGAVLWDISWKDTAPWRGETGRAIDVFVATIGKAATEYLVSFKLLTERMKTAGMELVKTEMFEEAYRRGKAGMQSDLTPVEKGLSFLYRSFVFQRVSK